MEAENAIATIENLEFDLESFRIGLLFGGSKAAKTLAIIAHKNGELGHVGKLFSRYNELFKELKTSNLKPKTIKTLSKRLLAESKINVAKHNKISPESKSYLNNILHTEYKKLLEKIYES